MESKLLEERKKKIYDLMCNELYVPMKEKELAILLQIPKEQRPELKEVLEALLDEEKITISKRGKYSKAEEKKDLVSGVFESHPKGFGFLRIEGEEEDIFIPESEVNGALHMDTVEVRVLPAAKGKRKEGTIVRILEHGDRKSVV